MSDITVLAIEYEHMRYYSENPHRCTLKIQTTQGSIAYITRFGNAKTHAYDRALEAATKAAAHREKAQELIKYLQEQRS